MVQKLGGLWLLTAALLLLLMGLGLRLQLAQRQVGSGHWLHHVLYFAVTALVLFLSVFCWLHHTLPSPLPLCAALLLAMPLNRPGTGKHWQLALACTLSFGWSLWLFWVNH